MKHLILASCLLAIASYAQLAGAQKVGLIDRPTPPPCAADGTCYPNVEAWGYYPGYWRTWPGVALEPTPAEGEPTPADLGKELVPYETPPPELEDQAAPPASTKRQPPAITAPATEEGAEPPSGPPAPPVTPPSASPTTGPPTTDADPPPAFPLSLSARANSAVATTAPAPGRRQSESPRLTANDPPPSPPWNRRASL